MIILCSNFCSKLYLYIISNYISKKIILKEDTCGIEKVYQNKLSNEIK